MWIKIAERSPKTKHRWIVTENLKDLKLFDLRPTKEALDTAKRTNETDLLYAHVYSESEKMLRRVRKEVHAGYYLMAQRKHSAHCFSLLVQERV